LNLIITDLHLKDKDQFGTKQNYLGFPINSRNIYKIDTLVKILDNNKDIEDVFIAGDLFDSPRPYETLRYFFLSSIMPFIKGKLFIITGNHDALGMHPIGMSESLFTNKLHVVPANTIMSISNDIILCGFHKNQEELYNKLIDSEFYSKDKILFGHGDFHSVYNKLPNRMFWGHNHLNYQSDNFISIGSLFKDSWAEENQEQGYYLLDGIKYKWFKSQDINIKTLTSLKESSDGYDAVRYKFPVTLEQFKGINLDKLKEQPTKVFLDFEIVEQASVDKSESINDSIKLFLESKKLTKEQLNFGLEILRG